MGVFLPSSGPNEGTELTILRYDLMAVFRVFVEDAAQILRGTVFNPPKNGYCIYAAVAHFLRTTGRGGQHLMIPEDGEVAGRLIQQALCDYVRDNWRLPFVDDIPLHVFLSDATDGSATDTETACAKYIADITSPAPGALPSRYGGAPELQVLCSMFDIAQFAVLQVTQGERGGMPMGSNMSPVEASLCLSSFPGVQLDDLHTLVLVLYENDTNEKLNHYVRFLPRASAPLPASGPSAGKVKKKKVKYAPY